MKELISEREFLWVLKAFAVLTPMAAGLWWLSLRRSVGNLRRDRRKCAVAVGLVGPGVFGAWLMYSAVTEAFGLDSLKGLVLNLAIFAAIGAGVALLCYRPGALRELSGAPRRH